MDKLLIIEDDETIRNALRILLEIKVTSSKKRMTVKKGLKNLTQPLIC